jgi:ABC-type uncharacterized transport system substrate-binding protein
VAAYYTRSATGGAGDRVSQRWHRGRRSEFYRRLPPRPQRTRVRREANVEILYRWAEMRNDRLPTLAADLVDRRVAIIVATRGNAPALTASKTIPIVFSIGADPVELGLVASLNRPGGNVTGVTVFTKTLTTKRLELLHWIVPAAKSIGFLVNPTAPLAETETREVEIAARILGVRLVIANATSTAERKSRLRLA